MNYDHFVQQVQHHARLSSNGEAVSAIRATLETLGERLAGGEPKDLAAQLPREIDNYLPQEGSGERFSVDEFFQRVSQKEGADLPDAVHHARAVMAVMSEAVTGGQVQDIRAQLPDEYGRLFDYAA